MGTEGLQLSHFIKRESYTVNVEYLKRTDTTKETDRSQSLKRKNITKNSTSRYFTIGTSTSSITSIVP